MGTRHPRPRAGLLSLRRLVPLLTTIALMSFYMPGLYGIAEASLGGWDGNDHAVDAGTTIHLTDACGGNDDIPINGHDYQLDPISSQPAPVIHLANLGNSSTDLCEFWLGQSVDSVSGHVYLYLAWRRAANSTTDIVGIEFHKQDPGETFCDQTDIANCNPFGERDDGDILLVYDTQGQTPALGTRVFSGGHFTPSNGVTPFAANEFEASTWDGGKQGEAVVDLTQTGVLPLAANATTCTSLASFVPLTATGNSPTADLKDVVLASPAELQSITLSNCGKLKVDKATVPSGLDGPFDFSLTGGPVGHTVNDSFQLTGDGSTNTVSDLFPGNNYALGETVPNGWDANYQISCDNGQAPSAIEVDVSTTTTCTVTNTADLPTLTLTKTVTNDDGGSATTADFTPKIDGNTSIPDPVTQAGQTVAWTQAITLMPGTYTASETPGAGGTGYTASSWGSDCAADGSVTLALGEDKTCSITNDDIAPTLTLVKDLPNDDGGNETASSFTPTIDGQTQANNQTVAWSTPITLDAGTQYTAGETIPAGLQAGYTPSSWSGDCAANGTITLAPGDTATCTITNDDVAPKLTLKKVVSSGNALASQFDLKVNDGTGAVTLTQNTPHDLMANTPYALTEDGPSNYALDSLVCKDGAGATIAGVDAQNNSIALDEGADVTCTFTNSEQQATLRLVKTIDNGDGGTATFSDFQAKVDGNDVGWDVPVGLAPGAHTASEFMNVSGYTAGSWGGDCAADGSITLANGDVKTCTITNDDIPPTLTVNKLFNTQFGGVGNIKDFTLTVTDPQKVDVGTTWAQTKTLMAGTAYTIAESGPVGWTQQSLSCSDGSGAVTSTNNVVTLALDQDVVCNLTNTDVQPQLTVVKSVVNDNGRSAKVADFPLFVNTTQVTSGVKNGYMANTDLRIYETQQPGYTLTGIACDNQVASPGPDLTLQLKPGDDVTCTLTNDDQPIPVTPSGTPGIGLDKQVSVDGGTSWLDADTTPGPTVPAGSDVLFRFVVTNTGTTTLSGIAVTDDMYPTTSCTWPSSLAPGASTTCQISQTAVVGQHSDIGTATAGTVTAIDPANYYGADTGIQVVKTADKQSVNVGDVITYTYTVRNVGNVPLTNVTVDDDILGELVTTADGINLAPGESKDLTATYTVTEDDLTNGEITNVVTAAGDPPVGARVSDTDTVTVPVNGLTIDKTAEIPADADGLKSITFDANAAALPTITYTYVVTNTGNAVLTNPVLVDDHFRDPIPLGVDQLAPGQSVTVQAVYDVMPSDIGTAIVNTAVVTATDPDGNEISATDSESVGVTEVAGEVIERPTPAPAPQEQPLPATGTNSALLLLLSALAMAAGVGLLTLWPMLGGDKR